MTYRECYRYGLNVLIKAGIADASIDARLLLEYVCHTSRHDLIVNATKEVSVPNWDKYQKLIQKRKERVPLQHITGEQAFMGFEFFVNEHVLIPRQDTEILVEETLQFVKSNMCVLDMCTGSGCILLSLLALAKDKESVQGVGIDISKEALEVACENLERVSIQCGKKLSVQFLQSDLFTVLENGDFGDTFDIIVSNPPYIASAVIETLEPEVRLHEPIGALDGTSDGLYFYREIIAKSKKFLKKDGILLFEIGYDQGEAVSTMMCEAGFEQVTVKKDYAGLDRVVYGFVSEKE